jgi:hypothetical protein
MIGSVTFLQTKPVQFLRSKRVQRLLAGMLMSAAAGPLFAQNTPPDLAVCDKVTACDASDQVCSAGFKVTLTGFTPAPASGSGTATYTYQICSPPAGTCSDGSKSCLSNSQCQTNHCQNGGPNAGTCSQNSGIACTTDDQCNAGITCSRECSVDAFRDLSHFDVPLAGIGGCVGSDAAITGTCAANDNTPSDGHTASVGSFSLADGSCFSSSDRVAKCDNTNLNPGDCLTMTVSIPGENNTPGKGNAIVVDKESTTCTAACMQGPSCEACNPPPGGSECLTRTLGFWGTHPWVTNDYSPVTVCGKPLSCSGPDDGKSNPSCQVGSCNSIMEGLGSIPSELSSNQPYVSMVKQLTAAKLNLNATAALFSGASCSDFRYRDQNIQYWVSYCEGLCGANKATITNSGCIEALNAFNNSQDTGFTATPAPFDRPPLDDHGRISGADSTGFTAAQSDKLVIGKNVPGGANCQ